MSEDKTVLRPILSDDPVLVPPKRKSLTFYERFTVGVRWVCGSAALISLVASLWFFIGFLENDTGLWHVLSAFFMSMGIGALAFVPALWVSRLARLTVEHGAQARTGFLVILLAMPWGGVGSLLLRLSGIWYVLGLAILALVTLINIWAFVTIMRARRQ